MGNFRHVVGQFAQVFHVERHGPAEFAQAVLVVRPHIDHHHVWIVFELPELLRVEVNARLPERIDGQVGVDNLVLDPDV